MDDFLFFDCLSSFYFLLIEFHCTFSLSYKILPYAMHAICIASHYSATNPLCHYALVWVIHPLLLGDPGALSKLLKREGRAGAEGALLPYVGHLQLILILKIGADCCQLCQYLLTKPNLT